MMHLLRSELFRLRKRPQTWILILIMIAAAGAFYASLTVATFILSDPSQAEQNLQLDSIFGNGMQLVLFTGSILSVVLASGLIGNEFGWNTIRPLLARATNRNALLTAKLVTVILATVTLFFVGFIATIVFSTMGALVAGSFKGIGAGTLVDWLTSMAGMMVSQVPYVILTFCAALLSRSNAAGIAIGIGAGILEPAIWGLLGLVTSAFDTVRKFGLEHPSSRLSTLNTNMQDVSSGEAWRAVIVLAAWSALMLVATFMVFNRRDVTSG